MPVGIMVNSMAILFGGLLGVWLKNLISDHLKSTTPILFGFSAMAIGIVAIVKIQQIHVVVLALILGGILGEIINLDQKINVLLKILFRQKKTKTDQALLILVITLFCFSGTGIFGAITEALTGDADILFAKSVLDFFTAMIFATTLGIGVALIFIPQLLIFLSIFMLAGFLEPMLTTTTVQNFIACGGVMTLMLGFSITKIMPYKVINLVPALILVILFSQWFIQ